MLVIKLGTRVRVRGPYRCPITDVAGFPNRFLYFIRPYVNVNVISRTALIRNRVSRRVFHVSKITWGILYLFQEAQAH